MGQRDDSESKRFFAGLANDEYSSEATFSCPAADLAETDTLRFGSRSVLCSREDGEQLIDEFARALRGMRSCIERFQMRRCRRRRHGCGDQNGWWCTWIFIIVNLFSCFLFVRLRLLL